MAAKTGALKVSEYLKKWIPFSKMRYATYMFATIFTLVVPWIKVNGNHFLLLSFDNFKFHFFFIKFDMQELYLMPFLLMILFVGVFGITVVGGRMFCGWFCPQTIFRVVYRDFIETKILRLRKRVSNKQAEPDYSKPINQVKRVVAVLLWTILAFAASANLLWYFVPPEDFFKQIVNPGEHTILMGTLLGIVIFLVYDIIILKENFCVYVCPYSRVQSVLYDDDTIMAIYDNGRGGRIYSDEHEKLVTKESQLAPSDLCTTCESCVTVCPTHIDIRKGLQLECINCLECVDACTTVMAKFNEPSLVNWSSIQEIDKGEKTRFFRPKIIGYIVILLALLIGLIIMGAEKELMLMNVNKDSRLYDIEKISDKKLRVENSYVVLMQNTENVDHTYYMEVQGSDKIKISQPSHPFVIKSGERKKKTLVLYTTDVLADNARKDTTLHLKIKAFAVDANESILVYRDIPFIYPRSDIVENKLK